VVSLEASRLARNGRDWHTLLEFCGLVGALIVDEEAIYDPRSPNDRLLLGMKGTMSEMELSVFRQWSVEAMRQKARRGELHLTVAFGYVKTDDNRIEKDPTARCCFGSGRRSLAHRRFLGGSRDRERAARLSRPSLPATRIGATSNAPGLWLVQIVEAGIAAVLARIPVPETADMSSCPARAIQRDRGSGTLRMPISTDPQAASAPPHEPLAIPPAARRSASGAPTNEFWMRCHSCASRPGANELTGDSETFIGRHLRDPGAQCVVNILSQTLSRELWAVGKR
jgi:hypothetical protein